MAIFGKNKKVPAVSVKAEKSESRPSTSVKASGNMEVSSLAHVLTRPRITEKAANMTAVNVYTFDIAPSATKRDVIAAVKHFYKVVPVKVNVVNTPAKRVRMRKKRGFGKTAAGRKAYVFLKKGQEIQFS